MFDALAIVGVVLLLGLGVVIVTAWVVVGREALRLWRMRERSGDDQR